jgi:hypothetical protein
MHFQRAGWQAASSILPELPFGNFFVIRSVSDFSWRTSASIDHRSNVEDSKFLDISARRIRSVPSRNSCAASLGPMRIGADRPRQEEDYKNQTVMCLARRLLNFLTKAHARRRANNFFLGRDKQDESRSSPCIR